MKFTITREQLQAGLAAVQGAVPSKTTLPVLANVLVEATKDGLRLSGTDLDLWIRTTISASVDQEGAITLPAKKLAEIVRELPSGPVKFAAAGESRVTIEVGKARFKLLGLPREEFPDFPPLAFTQSWSTAAKERWSLFKLMRSTEGRLPIFGELARQSFEAALARLSFGRGSGPSTMPQSSI